MRIALNVVTQFDSRSPEKDSVSRYPLALTELPELYVCLKNKSRQGKRLEKGEKIGKNGEMSAKVAPARDVSRLFT